ncbi:unnamed protein product [Euphydryas editha]|uniref:Uncharacterized protein n=1 Tax=Euphydryas editha TaxID=104508 RepID=A0AAU9TDH0_EUPED|nr:unnamed protein product [Euphydryas editha]
MRHIEAICVSRDRDDLGHEYASRNCFVRSNKKVNDFECQCKIDIICTCKRVKRKERYFNSSRQVYRSQRYTARDYTDIGVGSVKRVYRKRIKRIYLPETEEIGVGSSDFSFAQRTRNCKGGDYYQKETSSKCVGGSIEHINAPVVNKKISPIIKKMSGSTSPSPPTHLEKTVTNVDFNAEADKQSRENLQIDRDLQNNKLPNHSPMNEMLADNTKEIATTANIINKDTVNIGDGRTFSSDSLIQHVHNLENPSNEKVKTSIDLIENKMEREYRKIFTMDKIDSNINSKIKPIPELKSASILRRRFEALRRGLNKKDKQENKQEVAIKISSKLSVPSKRDVSIASDPPSLESRSYSNTKIYSPMPSISLPCDAPISKSSYEKPFTAEKEELSNWPEDTVDSNCQDVKDMFKLWGKKFNLEEDDYKPAQKQKKKVEIMLPKEKCNKKEKGRRFLFFGRKNKNKSKQTYKHKQGVTAGRCELGDGLTIKIGAVNNYASATPIEKIDDFSMDHNISGKDWLQRFLYNRIDSRNSVRVRWNNSMYTTSSSTVFELMDCVYKNTGVIFSSKSEITTGESSNYYSYLHPQVNFMQQNIQAWMIPKTITDKPIINKSVNQLRKNKITNKNIEITLSNQKWFIEKSKTFSQNVELVLHSHNITKSESSEYIVIDIPKGYFSETSSDGKNQSSDEQVYNIVEYETLNSNSYLNKRKLENKIESGDHASKDIQVTISVRGDEENKIKIVDSKNERQEIYINKEDSNGYIAKPRDVISVRIITQRDIRDIKKPILKINDHIDDKSVHALPPAKKCEIAESFLQDYYRNLTPLGVDILSWCVSSDKLHASSSNSLSFQNQGDGSKSCSNIYDQGSTIVSSCETSSCSHCKVEEEKKADDSRATKFFNKLIKRNVDPITFDSRKRVSPKDSYEVYKRRKLYAASNKSKWGVNDDRSEPCSLPEKVKQNISNERPKVELSNSNIKQNLQKKCKKHVQLQDCDIMNEILKEQLSDKIVEGILSFKGTGGCDSCKSKTPQQPKQTKLIPHPVCEIPQPTCKESCEKVKTPECFKKNSPACNVPTPPSCPVEPHSPCQKPCPPSPPPCQMSSSYAKPPLLNSSTQCDDRPKSIPPRIHPPKVSSPKRSRTCVCPKKQSLSNIPKCPVNKKTSCTSTSPRSTSTSPSKCRTSSPRKSPCNSCEKCKKSSSHDIPSKCRGSSPRKSPCNSFEKCKKSSSHDFPSKCRASSPRKSPCNSCENCKKSSSHDFPWPLKNQQCNTPSPKASGLSLKMSAQPCAQNSSSKCLNAFKRLIQKVSSSSFGQKECKPDCANRPKPVSRPCPPAPPPTIVSPKTPANRNKCRSTIPGLHLKKLPMPKTCSKDCLSGEESQGVIRLNSREKITIKVKQSTPSTEEIREGCNIKVKDEDGQTLYERRDYRKIDRNRMHFVKDMYRDPRIQRISTTESHNADIVLDKKPLEINGCKSDMSISNIIEINLNLKFRQGDKTAEVNMNKSVDTMTRELETSDTQHKSKEIYLLQDQIKTENEEADKRDVNIKILINNYKTPTKLITNKQSVSLSAPDEFSKKISEKFNTVSTGYSDIIENQTYSIHRTTVDLKNSSDLNRFKDQPDTILPKKDVIDANNNDDIICRFEKSALDKINSSYIIKKEKESQDILTSNAISEVEVNTSLEKTEATNDDKSATSISMTNTDENINSDSTNIQDKNKLKYRKFDKEEKKKILFRIFETASEIKRRKNKNEMQEIRQLLRAVLTSDSSDQNFEINNTLTEELTYTSLKPSVFKDSNSITNYYLDKSYTSKVSSKDESEDLIYPTKDNVSECSSSTDAQENTGCLCSHLADKLNIKPNINPCCCRGVAKIDEEINCDIKDDDRYKNIEVKTQYSEQIISKCAMSIASKNETFVKTLENSSKCILLAQNYTSVYQRQSLLEYSENDKKDLTDSNFECETNNIDDLNIKIVNIKSADVLQLNETKKAVLEIYAEKVKSNNGNRVIARLPKFICEKESNIYD